MDTQQLAGLLLGSSVLVAVINVVGTYLVARRKRKDDIEDQTNSKAALGDNKIEGLKNDTNKQFDDVRKDIGTLNSTVNALGTTVSTVVTQTNSMMKSQKAQAYDRIRHLGLQYIKAGEIDSEDLRVLTEMYGAYQQLPGADGFLTRLMSEVNNLRIKIT